MTLIEIALLTFFVACGVFFARLGQDTFGMIGVAVGFFAGFVGSILAYNIVLRVVEQSRKRTGSRKDGDS